VNLNKIYDLLVQTGAIMDGHFLLTSGKHSNRYIEKFRILENPTALDKVCLAISQKISFKNIDIVVGAAIGGILIAGGVGRHLNTKYIFSERIDGKMEFRRGFSIKKGMNIVIVEDIITTGGSVFELLDLIKSHQGRVKQIINIVDRSPDGIDFGVSSSSLLKIPSEIWEPNQCPQCKNNVPITKRGSTGK
tara:strand:- start:6086 stop:6658 length:573 start_codon:yes stop_codon:yes gene_type:complete